MSVTTTTVRVVMALMLWSGSTASMAEDAAPRSPWGDRAVLRAGQVVQGDYFAFGPHVEISGIVNGDLYAAGGEVIVDGVVNGDVIVAGAKVVLSGTVAQDARVVGAQVTVSGTIGRNATIGGVDVHLTDRAKVRENLLAGGGHVQLAGSIDRDFVVAAESVRLTSKASVGGRLRYWGEAAPSIDEEATVRGLITRRPLPEGWSVERARQGLIGMRVLAAVVSFLSTLILGLILLRIYPQFAARATATILERPGLSLGWGVAAFIITPIVAISFVVTLLALPVGVILLVLYGVTLYLARIYAVTCAGQFLLRRRHDSSSLTGPFVAGLVLYSLLSLVPVVGGLLTLSTMLFGLGAVLLTKKDVLAGLQEQDQV